MSEKSPSHRTAGRAHLPQHDPGDHSSEAPSPQVGGKRAEAPSPGAASLRFQVFLDGTGAWRASLTYPYPQTFLCQWRLLVLAAGAQDVPSQGGHVTTAPGSWAVAAPRRPGAGPSSPPCMPMRRTWGPAGSVEGTGDPGGAVASQVAGRSGLPRPARIAASLSGYSLVCASGDAPGSSDVDGRKGVYGE
jgi:hypothetical protein